MGGLSTPQKTKKEYRVLRRGSLGEFQTGSWVFSFFFPFFFGSRPSGHGAVAFDLSTNFEFGVAHPSEKHGQHFVCHTPGHLYFLPERILQAYALHICRVYAHTYMHMRQWTHVGYLKRMYGILQNNGLGYVTCRCQLNEYFRITLFPLPGPGCQSVVLTFHYFSNAPHEKLGYAVTGLLL